MKTVLLTCLACLLTVSVFSQIDMDHPSMKRLYVPDDLYVDESICVGFDCPQSGFNFGANTIVLRENNLRIRFEDTSTSGSFPSRDWALEANESTNGGIEHFSIVDITAGRTPFRIRGNAPANSLFVHSNGNIGIGIAQATTKVHMKDGNTPTMRLDQDGSSGFTPQVWDVAGNEANFFIRDVTHASELPFRITPGAPDNMIYIDGSTDRVGIGTDNPEYKLHVVGDIGLTGQIFGASDLRIKKDIRSIDDALALIRLLDGKSYDYRSSEYAELELPRGRQYGLIAQEVEEVLPDIVNQHHTKIEDDSDRDGYLKGINYDALIPILVNAIKEQEKHISALQSDQALMQERLASLEDEVNSGDQFDKNSSGSSAHGSTTTTKVSVEDVHISKDNSIAWAVRGSVRNNSTHSINGAVKIQFIDRNGDIVHSNRAYVNGGDHFSLGQSANFEYFANPDKFNDVVDFQVEFYER